MFIDVIAKTLTEQTISSSVSALEGIMAKISDYAILLVGKIIVALLIFFVGKFLISRLRKVLTKILLRKKLDETIRTFLDSLINISLKIILAVIIIGQLGIQTTSFAAIIAAAGLAIGMAMKDNLSNFAGGVMILFNRPFKVKDRILALNQDGVVQSIGILYTVLLTPDNRTLFIPNGPLSTGSIINYTTQETRRVDVTITLGNTVDLDNIKSIIAQVVAKNGDILVSPEPIIELSTINNGSIDIAVRVWTKTTQIGVVTRYLNEGIYTSLLNNKVYAPAVTTVKIQPQS